MFFCRVEAGGRQLMTRGKRWPLAWRLQTPCAPQTPRNLFPISQCTKMARAMAFSTMPLWAMTVMVPNKSTWCLPIDLKMCMKRYNNMRTYSPRLGRFPKATIPNYLSKIERDAKNWTKKQNKKIEVKLLERFHLNGHTLFFIHRFWGSAAFYNSLVVNNSTLGVPSKTLIHTVECNKQYG